MSRDADPPVEPSNRDEQADQGVGDDLARWVGRRASAEAYLDPAQANRMAVTLDRPPTFVAGDPLPPAWHWLYFHDLIESSRLGADGHPAPGVTMPPVQRQRRMWAAGSLTFDETPRLGESVTRTSTISSVVDKSGRTGPLTFVTVDHDVSSVSGPRIREQQTIVYRDMSAVSQGEPPSAAPGAQFNHQWTLDSTTLFRYSALTFNAHRIHYDADYARQAEAYPGLVVHGPLLATLLTDLATENCGRLARFVYQARSPLFAPAEVTVSGRRTHDGAQLWAASPDGRLAMAGTATFKENQDDD